jgi:hypothetical protein
MPKITNIKESLCYWSIQKNEACHVLTWDDNGTHHSKHFRFPWQRELFKQRLKKSEVFYSDQNNSCLTR